MKILVLGDPNKFFRIEYVRNMKKKYNQYEFHIASNIQLNVQNSVYDKVIYLKYDPSKNKFFQYLYLMSQIKELEDYDYIHIHSANMFWLPLLNSLKKKAKKIILTYYGSDFYRVNKKNKMLLVVYNQLVDKITFTSKRMKIDVSSYILNKNKVKVIPFGITTFEDINICFEKGKVGLKNDMNIPVNNIVITVGYNATKQQRHLDILKTVQKVAGESRNITVLFPLNYGDSKYKTQLIAELDKYDLDIKTSIHFLPSCEIAKLRYISDIMIHMQDSDQFSASIVEYLYAENVLINCSWIDYKELKEWGVYYREVLNYNELEMTLIDTIKNIDVEKNKLNARLILNSKLDWEVVIEKWNKLYQ